MNQDVTAYLFAFSSVLTFSTAAIGFTYFSQKLSPLWMNVFKCLVSFLICVPAVYFLHGKLYWNIEKVWPLYLSGFIGLNVGDWFLLNAYKRIGPGRSLLLFGFQPFIAGSFAYFAWGEKIYPIQFVAIVFFVCCLFLFSYEKFKQNGEWEFKGLAFAFCGVVLDSVGIILTRHGFDKNPELSGLDVHYLRILAALVSFVVYLPVVKVGLLEGLKLLNRNEKILVTVSSFFGTFLSLIFYMQAVKVGKLATVTSILLADPMMSTLFESLWLKTWPTRYLWMALACFLCAMFCLFYPQFG